MPELVLASTSRYRMELLERLGVPFRALAHRCDERAIEPRGADEETVALTLARAKAESLADVAPEAYVLGSDQVVGLDGTLLHKPGSRQAAIDQLERLAGRTHRIVTAMSLRAPDGTHTTHVDVHRMHMRQLDRDAIARYVDADEPFDCAGSYKLEKRGIALFEAVEGADATAVVGLPLIALVRMLGRAGFAVP
jgi:septum formation protein